MGKQTEPLISIIMPVYGVEKWIDKSLRSALAQDYSPLEILLVDDASPDRSINIVRDIIANDKSGKDIRIITHEKNKGLAKARETGIKQAKGAYIFHLDSDDWIESNCISFLASFIDSEQSVDIVSANCRNVFANKITNRNFKETQDPKKTALGMMKKHIYWNIWNRLIKKSLYDGIEIPAINNGEDYIGTIQLIYKAKKIIALPEITYNYNRLNENAFQHKLFEVKNIQEREEAVQYLLKVYKSDDKAKDALNIGLLISKISNILLIRKKEDYNRIEISPSLLKIKYLKSLNFKYLPIIALFKLKFYSFILFLKS